MSSKVSPVNPIVESMRLSTMHKQMRMNDVESDDELTPENTATCCLLASRTAMDNVKCANQTMANDILNDILETAMDIAIGGDAVMLSKTPLAMGAAASRCPTTAGTRCADDPTAIKGGVSADLKDIIEGLSRINVNSAPGADADAEMKRILSEMLSSSPPPPSNLGIGDSAITSADVEHQVQQQQKVAAKQSKPVEKKSRITDLVMNSKKALNNLLSEEQRRKQDEWEERNEHVIQVIELQQAAGAGQQPSTPSSTADGVGKQQLPPPEAFPLPIDEEEVEMVRCFKEDADHVLEAVELTPGAEAVAAPKCGEGDEQNADGKELDAAASKEPPGVLDEDRKKVAEGGKRKKWSFPFKFFSFRRGRSNNSAPGKKGQEEGVAPTAGAATE